VPATYRPCSIPASHAASRCLQNWHAGQQTFVSRPNASTHGPPTSSAVPTNLGNSDALADRFPANRLEARLLPAVSRPTCSEATGTSKHSHDHQMSSRMPGYPYSRPSDVVDRAAKILARRRANICNQEVALYGSFGTCWLFVDFCKYGRSQIFRPIVRFAWLPS